MHGHMNVKKERETDHVYTVLNFFTFCIILLKRIMSVTYILFLLICFMSLFRQHVLILKYKHLLCLFYQDISIK
jgi:hypothetical protein